MTADGRVKCAA